jgi:hypothetical protein
MNHDASVIAVYDTHPAAELAIKTLAESGLEMGKMSVIGQGYHSEEKVIGFYNLGDRVKFWGMRGAFWGGLWGLFFGGLILTVPVVGHLVVLGYLATVIVGAVENALLVGGLSAIGAALFSIGVPKDSIIQYETDLKTDHFLVTAHGSTAEIAQAKTLLAATHPLRIETHFAPSAQLAEIRASA